MTDNIYDKRKSIISSATGRQLHKAFSELYALSGMVGSWQFDEDIHRAEDSYKMMLKYVVTGVDDPARDALYGQIEDSVCNLADGLTREYLKKTSSSKVYFSTLRLLEMQRVSSIPVLIERYIDNRSKSSIYNLISGSEMNVGNMRQMTVENENLETDIFNKVWTAYPLTVEDIHAIDAAFKSAALPQHFKHLLLSALLLGAIDFYENSRLGLMLSICQQSDESLSLKALCAVVIVMSLNPKRITDTKLLNQIETLREMPGWHKNLAMVYLQLIRTCDTERVSRKMQDELLPEMMKLRPDIRSKFNLDSSSIDLNSIDENVEWQEMLENSGLVDKMKELNELQQDGSDVFMSTFSHLKSYPFFSAVSNWFLPFHLEHSEVIDAVGQDSVLGQLIQASPHLCNSDKYSFVLSLKSVPESQRSMMVSQLDAQNINIAELQNASITADEKRRENIVNKYIQDLYRFFRLNRYHDDFVDPFASLLQLMDCKALREDLREKSTLLSLADFYFKYRYFSQAYDMLVLLADVAEPSESVYLRLGYIKQKQGNIEAAIKYYQQAELLDARNPVILRHLGTCFRLAGDDSRALEYYQRLELIRPEDISVLLNIGHCYLALGDIHEALHYYYKAEFQDEQSLRPLRPVAWCLLLNRDLEQAESYYHRIIDKDPTPGDYLNLGHVYYAQNNLTKAVESYKQSIIKDSGNTRNFVKSMSDDKPTLEKIGIDTSILSLIVDAVLYDK